MPESNASSDASSSADAAESEPDTAEAEVFANRAARRAKGKGSATPAIAANGKRPVAGRTGVQSPRQYGTRRSG
jgi:hypothetical protein